MITKNILKESSRAESRDKSCFDSAQHDWGGIHQFSSYQYGHTYLKKYKIKATNSKLSASINN